MDGVMASALRSKCTVSWKYFRPWVVNRLPGLFTVQF